MNIDKKELEFVEVSKDPYDAKVVNKKCPCYHGSIAPWACFHFLGMYGTVTLICEYFKLSNDKLSAECIFEKKD